jgi:trigger factor
LDSPKARVDHHWSRQAARSAALSRDQREKGLLDNEEDRSLDVGEESDSLEEEVQEELQPLDLTVAVETRSACERHVTVTISREDIDRYCDKAFSELMPTAAVPGFRPGRAPRKLVESRFRKEILDQVKGSLLVDSVTQVTETENFTAIGEPDFDLNAVEVPHEGPMTFEFNLEVRPEFDLPKYKGLTVDRPVRQFGEADVDRRLRAILARYGDLIPVDRPAAAGDYVSLHLSVFHDGQQIDRAEELVARVASTLSLRDAVLTGFDKLIVGAAAGDVRKAAVEVSADAENEELRGQTVELQFEILEVKELKFPELTAEFLGEMGEFASENDLRQAIREDLSRQLVYLQNQEIRRQISNALTASADWDLPPGLLRRQAVREVERMVMELRSSGFSEAEIRARGNELRRNSMRATASALKEHFILERIAEEEKIDAQGNDYDREIELIALQSGQSPRRVRAQIEKRGLMDVLRNQIIERKVIELVRSQARFRDVPLADREAESADVEAIDVAVAGAHDTSSIPQVESPARKGGLTEKSPG